MKNDPAFPIDAYITPLSSGLDGFNCKGPSGLTKRELFAAMAMQSLNNTFVRWPNAEGAAEAAPHMATAAVIIADALIDALEKSK